jgi:NAD(P)-dependent dehydrogenase (short-subunit alcohol dehydrogenase family)
MKLLDGKVAIVTGAGRGIGRATALLFAREGAHVIVNDLGTSSDGTAQQEPVATTVVAEIAAAGGSAVASTVDVSSEQGAAQLAELALAHNGQIDVLVNNAGIQRDSPLSRLSLTDWHAVLAVHLQATFLCIRATSPHMKPRHGGASTGLTAGSGGSIINTTSSAGLYGNHGQAAAAAALSGVYGLTRSAAIELQRHGVRVNAVAPLAKTRLTENLPIFHQVSSMRAEHVAPVHLFLASALGQEVTGCVVGVAGGRISAYKMVESRGQFKDDDEGVWTAQEIADHWTQICKQ